MRGSSASTLSRWLRGLSSDGSVVVTAAPRWLATPVALSTQCVQARHDGGSARLRNDRRQVRKRAFDPTGNRRRPRGRKRDVVEGEGDVVVPCERGDREPDTAV